MGGWVDGWVGMGSIPDTVLNPEIIAFFVLVVVLLLLGTSINLFLKFFYFFVFLLLCTL